MTDGAQLLDDRSATLTRMLLLAATEAGCTVHADDLHAVLGLPLLVCAVPEIEDVSLWCMYARDRFVVPAARQFGMRLRDLHPPDVARGLDAAEEFEQHFDASYRPFIHRALEHSQPVLAWRGWRGEVGPTWGLIRRTCKDGVGFSGTTVAFSDGACSMADAVLDHPASQVYVVEEIERATPSRDALHEMALRHARYAITGRYYEHAGVLSGTAALEWWKNACAKVVDRDHDSKRAGSRVFVESILVNVASLVRFLDGMSGNSTAGANERVELQQACQGLCDSCNRWLEAGKDRDLAADLILADFIRGQRIVERTTGLS